MKRFSATHHSSAVEVLREAILGFIRHDMSTYAAALAYRLLFSLFPFLVFLTALLGVLGAPQLFEWMREQAAVLLPVDAMTLVDTVVAEMQRPRGGVVPIAVALTLWSASAAVLGTMDALNVVFEVKERRAIWKRILAGLFYTAALAIMIIVSAALMIAGPRVIIWATGYVRLDSLFLTVWNWARWPVVLVLLMVVVSTVYSAAPNVRQRFRLITPGAMLAVVAWVAASLGFGFYVRTFASYNTTYGSMGAVIILLLYFFLSAVMLLFGAEINAALARSEGKTFKENLS